MRGYFNESSTTTVLLKFTDYDNVPVVPLTCSYRVDDRTSGQSVIVDTPLYPIITMYSLVIDAADNDLINQANQSEERVVTVEYTYAGGVKTDEYVYILKNLQFYPG